MNELIKIKIKNLVFKVDEKYLYCEATNICEFKISIKIIKDIVMFANSKIQR